LDEVTEVAKTTANNLVSVGVSLSHAHVPNHPLFDAQTDDYLASYQLGKQGGIGMCQAPGSQELEADLPGIVRELLKQLLDWRDEDRSFSHQDSKNEWILLVNNLGGLSGLELGGITLVVASQLQSTYNTKPVRVFSGTYMSSLNEVGFSISLLKVVDLHLWTQKQMLELLDAPAEVTGWSAPVTTGTWQNGRHMSPETKMPVY
jgi:triose/dihydroxyacetone kinase / FAD-AMP lyase (cyclizing)